MNYRIHKDLNISAIGIGCYALSGAYGKKDPAQFQRMLHRAFDLGVNFFDTADAYGDAEQILGEAIRPFRRQVYVATKVGLKQGTQPNLSPEYIKEACDRSLRNLQTDCIDLYQVHFDDPDTPVAATITGLESLVSAGKIRHYGVGHLPIERVSQYLQLGQPFSVLMEFSAVEQTARQGLLDLCCRHEAGAIAFSVTGRGLLTGKYTSGTVFAPGDIRNMDPLFQRERFRSGLRVAGRLAALGSQYRRSAVQVAIAWVLSQPGVLCALTGPSTVEHLEENLGGSGWTIRPEDLQELDRFFQQEREILQREQHISVKSILLNPLPSVPHQAFVDLVYALETAILLRQVSEAEILPVFYRLISLRAQLEHPDVSAQLEAIRDQALSLILPDSRRGINNSSVPR